MNFDEGAVDIGNFEPTDYPSVNDHGTAADNEGGGNEGGGEIDLYKNEFIYIFLFLQNYY